MTKSNTEFNLITERAALACYDYIGIGDKEAADEAAVSAMREVLNNTAINGEVVIGEGEIDEAPMLYIGEKVGSGGMEVDIAVDPIDGTRMVGLGQDNAVAVIVLAKKGTLLNAPDMYMEKLMVGKKGKGSVDINLDIKTNIINLAKQLNKDVQDIRVMTLSKPRHEKTIKEIQSTGAKVIAIPDGDVAGSVLVAMPDANVDMFYGIGGTPEGVISAAIIKVLDGDMQGRLIYRNEAKGASNENDKFTEIERKKLLVLGIDYNKTFQLEDLCSTEDVVISMTGITKGTLLDGVIYRNGYFETDTLLIKGRTGIIRKIKSQFLK